ncbi:MAG: hypothetical protein RL885_08655 [Planctomycetota bacterium]
MLGSFSLLWLLLLLNGSGESSETHPARSMRGFTIRVDARLLEAGEHETIGRDVLELLERKLFDVERAVPKPVLEELRKVTIWVEYEAKDPCAVYHPSREWLIEHDYEPGKARCVEIANAKNFLAWTRHQPAMVIHELMHAYHHQVLGYGHAGIREAFEKARESGAYDEVLHIQGSKKRHYALSNEREYFAEICEAWFGTNDFFPFVRAELKEHDAAGHALLEKLF